MNKLIYIIFALLPLSILGQIDSTTIKFQQAQIKSLNGICKEVNSIQKAIKDNTLSLEEISVDLTKTIEETYTENVSSIVNAISDIELQQFPELDQDTFNWGDFFSSAFVEILGAFVGFGGALFLFYKQNRKDEIDARADKLEEEKSKMEYINSINEMSLRDIEGQMKMIKEYIDETKKNPLYLAPLGYSTTGNLERLKNVVDNPLYYEAYISQIGRTEENTKNYKNLIVSSDYFLNQFGELRKIEANKADYKRKIEYKQLFDEAKKLLVNFGESFVDTNNPIYKDIGDVIYNYETKKIHENFESHQNLLIEPARKLLMSKYYEHESAKECLNLLSNATQVYNDIKLQNLYHIDFVEQIFDTMNGAKEVLKDVATKMNT